VWELQHGIPDGNIAYFYGADTVDKYKNHLPLPDGILTFGQYFADRFVKGNIWKPNEMVNVGLARLEHHQRGFAYEAPVLGEKIRVLITSQWTVADRITAYLEAAAEQLPPNVVLCINNSKACESRRNSRALNEILK